MPTEGGNTAGYVISTGTFTAAGNGTPVQLVRGGDFNVSLAGTFVANVVPEKSFDGGTTWVPFAYIDGTAISWTAPMSTILTEAERGGFWRLRCSAFTSGTVSWRLGQ